MILKHIGALGGRGSFAVKRCRFVMAIACALAGACGEPARNDGAVADSVGALADSEVPPPPEELRDNVAGTSGLGDPRSPEGDGGNDLEALRALPYVQWSEPGADRNLRGVTLHDHERAWPGLNLYTNDRDQVYLLDMEGKRVHSWSIPETRRQHCEHAELLDGGTVAVICVNDSLFLLDRRSNVVLERRLEVHHDVAPVGDGTFVVPYHSIRPYRMRMVYFDSLAWIDSEGQTIRTWSTWEHLDRLREHHPASPLDESGPVWKILSRSYDYYHLNAVELLPATPLGERDRRFRAGNLLLCLRNPALVLVLDQDTEEVVWSWGPGELDGPHTPTLLDSGNVLVFDNGTKRGWSRVVEVDPLAKRIVWEYRADPPEAFLSKWRGSSQRLPNGNTLICETDRGHVFEVTPQGERVWEFWNPELKSNQRKGIYRFTRVEPERAEWAVRKPGRRARGEGAPGRRAGRRRGAAVEEVAPDRQGDATSP